MQPSGHLDPTRGSARFSARARLASFRHAANGLRWLVRDEHNSRLHAAISIGVVTAGGLMRIAATEWRWLILATALVWMAEVFNTVVERLCDTVSPGFNPEIGRIKDLAASAVLVAAAAAASIGLLTFSPPLLERLL